MQLNPYWQTDTGATRFATLETTVAAIENRLVSIVQQWGCLKRALEDHGDLAQSNSTSGSILCKLYSLEHYLAGELSKLTETVPPQYGMLYEEDGTTKCRNQVLSAPSQSKISTPTQETQWDTGQPSSSPWTNLQDKPSQSKRREWGDISELTEGASN